MTAARWTDHKLGDVLTLKYGKGLPERERVRGPYPVYGSGGIVGYHEEPLVKGPGIIVGRKGSIGTIYFDKRGFYPIDTVFYAELNESGYDFKFLFYLLSQLNLAELNSDAAVPGLSRDVAHRQRCKIPPISTQRKIASVLSAYDDLIENNIRRIKILEEMAQAIYREWFVHFRFPGHDKVSMVDSDLGPIPEGWEVKRLGEVMELAYGKALKADSRVAGRVPVYGSGGIVGYHNESLIDGPGVIVGRKGSVGSVYWSDRDFFPIDTVFYVQTEVELHYAYYHLQDQNFINNDAAVPGLSRKQAYSLPFLLPTREILERFQRVVDPIFQQVQTLKDKNDNLRRTRDLLLPKLVSGEVNVAEVTEETL